MKTINIKFLKALLSNQKKALPLKQIVRISIPQYRELTVTKLVAFAYEDPLLRDYLPEES